METNNVGSRLPPYLILRDIQQIIIGSSAIVVKVVNVVVVTRRDSRLLFRDPWSPNPKKIRPPKFFFHNMKCVRVSIDPNEEKG